MMIMNLTQHKATPDQVAAGVMDLEESQRQILIDLLTFDSLPSAREVQERAEKLGELAREINKARQEGGQERCIEVMIGGAPFLMAPLERALCMGEDWHIPVYAFSTRESVEEQQADGSVAKRNVFRHKGFVQAFDCEI